jgi:membrane fusion protein (multidrug efflux system)
MRRLCRSVPILLLLAAIAGCGGNGNGGGAPGGAPGGPGGQQPPPQVGVVTIQPQRTTLTTELPGRTLPFAESDVRPQVSGILKARLFTEGSQVKAGQPLYQIDDARYVAAYESAKARLASAKAALTTARLKAERYASLRTNKLIGQQDVDDAQAALEQALANVEQQTADLETARINLGYTRITAPISGKISRSYLTQGALVEANQDQVLATIQTLDPIYVDMNQSTSELLVLRRAISGGQLEGESKDTATVTLTFDDGTPYPLDGILQFREVAVDETTGSVTLRAQFPNPDGVLLPGMFVRARIIQGVEEKALLVPQRGVGRDERGNPTALVVADDGTAEQRMLTVQQTVGSNWLVKGGIEPGDRVVVEGLQFARAGQKVNAVPFSEPNSSSTLTRGADGSPNIGTAAAPQ